MNSKTPSGMTAIFVCDGRVLAHASDFAPDKPGGYTVEEAQKYRAKRRLAFEVVKALASPRLYENLDQYDCERIMAKIKGEVHIVPVTTNESSDGQVTK